LLCRQRAGQALRSTWKVVATDQMSQIGKLRSPGKLLENGAQKQQVTQVDGLCQGWGVRAQMGKPAEDVGITVQLIERTNGGMVFAEIDQEVARRATVLTGGVWTEGGCEGLDGSLELVNQWMFQRSVAGEPHERVPGTGLICCATTRAYC